MPSGGRAPAAGGDAESSDASAREGFCFAASGGAGSQLLLAAEEAAAAAARRFLAVCCSAKRGDRLGERLEGCQGTPFIEPGLQVLL